MKVVRIHEYGTSENLVYEKISTPALEDDKLLVKVCAASVNHLDAKKASGDTKKYMPIDLPWIPGHDFAGVVEKVGKNVSGFKKGDEVYGNCNGGSYAEYLVVSPSTVVLKPEKLSFVEAASIPHVAETAWQAIHKHGRLQAGESVLIHGAAGAVGAYAVQFAHLAGAKVYATAGAEDKKYLESLGADVIINYKKEDFTQLVKDIDLVLDLIGGDTQSKSFTVMKNGGRLVSTVGQTTPKEEPAKKQISVIPMIIEQSGEDLQKITDLINEGKMKYDVALLFPLPEAPEAWDVLQRKNPSLPTITRGKIVLGII